MERQMKTVRNNDRADVMSQYKKLSADWTREILYSLRLSVVLVLQIRIHSLGPNTILGVFGKGNPPCNAEDNLCAGHLVIEAWFRGY